MRIETQQGSGRRTGMTGVNDKDMIRLLKLIEQRRRLPRDGSDAEPWPGRTAPQIDETAHGAGPDPVVAALRITDAQNEHAGFDRYHVHRRSMFSRRKCVAQEIQGS